MVKNDHLKFIEGEKETYQRKHTFMDRDDTPIYLLQIRFSLQGGINTKFERGPTSVKYTAFITKAETVSIVF